MSEQQQLKEYIEKLPDLDNIESMDIEEIKELLKRLDKINYALGNGTLKTLKDCTKKCKLMIALAGELNDDLKK